MYNVFLVFTAYFDRFRMMSSLHVFMIKKLSFRIKYCFLQKKLIQPALPQLVSKAYLSFKPIFKKIQEYPENLAIIDIYGKYNYREIMFYGQELSKKIRHVLQFKDTSQCIVFMCPNDASYVGVLLACWLSGNVAVPLCKGHPSTQLEYFITDSQSSLIVANEELLGKVQFAADKLKLPLLSIKHPSLSDFQCPTNAESLPTEETEKDYQDFKDIKNSGAIIIYTSGTTGPPKGVVLTHGNFHAQISSLVEAWHWTSNDVILHTLPLHHMHGIMNALLCPLSVGACVVMLPQFNAYEVWNYLLNEQNTSPRINLFFAVPTIYAKLIEKFIGVFQDKKPWYSKEKVRKNCMENIRLMTCGSAALPESVLHRWEEITGHRLLERYGMSEIGMALSNPLHGLRIPGSVGTPLPEVEVCIVKMKSSAVEYDILVQGNHKKTQTAPGYKGESGDLLIRGPGVFEKYWNKPKETREAFLSDNWFKTGDTAAYVDGVYRILGRTSSDIIKSGGYKISALDVERYLLMHPDITDCAVVGLPDEMWGERVAAVITTSSGTDLSVPEIKTWCKEKIPPYAVPTSVKCVKELPRNIMGKVNKKELKLIYF